MLELDHVTIAYGETQAVEDFSLHMEPGEIVSLVGESGSGKTSVIRGILGLLPGGGAVTQGNIVFDGKNLLNVTPEQWRTVRGREISMIFQDSGAMMNPTRKIGTVFAEYLRTHEKLTKKEAWEKGRWRNKIVAFRVSPEEAEQIDACVRLSGLSKQDYITKRLTDREIVVQGNPRVYKALRNQMAEIYEELKRLEKCSEENEELLSTLRLIAETLYGLKGENE